MLFSVRDCTEIMSTISYQFWFFFVDPGNIGSVKDKVIGLEEEDLNIGLIIAALAGKYCIPTDNKGRIR